MRAPVELEWNPLSTASRAARAERSGRIAKALRLYAKANQPGRIIYCLETSLPTWPEKPKILNAAKELLDLQEAAGSPEAEGLPGNMTRHLLDDAERTAEALWMLAGAVVAAAVLKSPTSSPTHQLNREMEKLDRLLARINEARDSLAAVAFSRGVEDLRRIEESFSNLAAAADALKCEIDEMSD